MKKNIVDMVVILLIMVATVPLTANWLPSTQQVEPEGRIIFTARSTGPCAVCWHALATVEPPPEFYVEQGKGFIINFGTMLYHSLNGTFTNYLVENTTVEQLWGIKEITLMHINWQHEGIKHSLWIVCKPFKETTATFFTNQKTYVLGAVPGFDARNYSSICMTYSGSYRNGTKNQNVSGYAIICTFIVPPNSSKYPVPPIMIQLLQNKDGGEIESFLLAMWFKDGWNNNGTIIEKANTFHTNYWQLT